MKILGIGNALVDILTPLENENLLNEINFPKGSMQLVDNKFKNSLLEKTNHIDKSIASGGSAANTINGIANLGLSCSYIGKIGNDEIGGHFKNDLDSLKIEPLLKYSNTDTGTAIAMITPDSERTFATYLGAAIELSAEDLYQDMFTGKDLLHIEGYLVQNHELIKKAIELAKKCNLKVSLDLASFNVVEDNLEFLKEIVSSGIDILFANEEEAKAFTSFENPLDSLHQISSMVDIAIVKIGSKGSLIKKDGNITEVGVIQANPIDTTGAGDLYASGFIYGLAKGYDIEKCGKIGALVAGNVIEVIGAKMDGERWLKIKSEIQNL